MRSESRSRSPSCATAHWSTSSPSRPSWSQPDPARLRTARPDGRGGAADPGEEPADVRTGLEADESQVGVRRVFGSGFVALPVDRVLVPGPGDDRLLRVPGEQIRPPL